MSAAPKLRALTLGVPGQLRQDICGSNERLDLVAAEGAEVGPERYPHVGAVLVHESAGLESGTGLVDRVRKGHPGVPLVLLQQRPRALTMFGTTFPDLVWVGDIEGEKFSEQLLSLAQADLYPEVIFDGVVDSAKKMLAQSFGTEVRTYTSFLESDAFSAEVEAYVPFCGAYASGHMSVGGSSSTFDTMLRRLSSESSERATHDLAGEVCNQVLGEFKRVMSRHSLIFNAGAPIDCSGEGVMPRFPNSPARLRLQLECEPDGDSLFVGLMMGRLATAEIQDSEGHAHDAGELIFL